MDRDYVILDRVSVWYGDSERPAVQSVNLRVREGEFILILGPSGSGKSTLVKTIAGIIPHVEKGKITGTVKVCDLDPRECSLSQLCRVVTYVAQSPYDQTLFSKVEDEIMFTLENVLDEYQQHDIEQILKMLHVEHLRDRKTSELSGGELQKVIIACILVLNSKIIILDEPFAHLDPQSCEEFRNVLRILKENGKTILLVEHRIREVIDLIQEGVINRIIVIKDGRVLADFPSRNFLDNIHLLYKLNLRLPLNLKIALITGRKVSDVKDVTPLIEILSNLKQLENKEQLNVNNDVIIRLRGVWAGYEACRKKLQKVIKWVLKNVNIDFKRGLVYAVLGPNGSGKSTLLNTIIHNVPHVRGEINVLGRKVRRLRDLQGLVGYVPQNPDLILMCDTVERELLLRARLATRSMSEARALVREVARKFNLESLLSKNPHALSRGQRFRVAVATLLALKPKVLLLDEPTTGQDEECIQLLGDAIREVVRENAVVILVTHDIDFVRDYCDHVVLMRDGEIVFTGPTVEVLCLNEVLRMCSIKAPDYIQVLCRHGLAAKLRMLLHQVSAHAG